MKSIRVDSGLSKIVLLIAFLLCLAAPIGTARAQSPAPGGIQTSPVRTGSGAAAPVAPAKPAVPATAAATARAGAASKPAPPAAPAPHAPAAAAAPVKTPPPTYAPGLGPSVAFGPLPAIAGLPMPHAWAEADADQAHGVSLKAMGDTTGANNAFYAEIKALSSSAGTNTFKGTPYGALMLYRVAHVYVDYLRDPNTAMATYNTLLNQYHNSTYLPHASVVIESAMVSRAADLQNQRVIYWGIHPYYIIDFFVALTGRHNYSYALSLLFISLVVRLALTPLTLKQYRGMAEMQRLQPKIKEINKKYEKDPQAKNQKIMEMYREHNVNPLGGCLPTLLQLPIYYAMYYMVRLYQYHFYDGTFLWIGSSLAKDFPGIVAHNLMEPDTPLLLLYCVSMYLTQRMMPATDPQQAEVQKTTALMTSVMFFYIFYSYHFSSAFVLYWLISNILSSITQVYFMRRGLYAPAGVTPTMPSDGDRSIREDRNGSAPAFLEKPVIGSNGAKPHGKPGTAKGTISPKPYPKKKRR